MQPNLMRESVAIQQLALRRRGAGTLCSSQMVCLFFDLRFVDEHNGDVVANRVHALTLYALQTTLIRLQLYGRFAQRTHQDVQQVLTNRHGSIHLSRVVGVGCRLWERQGFPTTHSLELEPHLQFEPAVISHALEGSEAAR